MKYVLMFCHTPELGDKVDPSDSEANYQEIFAWFDEHYAAGHIVDGGAELQPATTAAKSWPALKFPGVSVEVRPIVDHGEDS